MARLAGKLKRDVAAIALPEGRMIGSAGHEKARRYLLQRMEELGLEPYEGNSLELPYTWDGEEFVNLVGIVPGALPSARPIIIGAHFEIRRIKKACGVAFPYVLQFLGVERLETRKDISELAMKLLAMGI